ncbi:hypothetical protein VPH46_02555 [Sphingomonas sp. MJ1 (PH-R8)]|uniref:hypothetical protein n=1 Tax=Sphingomonas sp. MJ1 (PH-R8) TaxID=3112950 RepID=UPI003A8ABC9E
MHEIEPSHARKAPAARKGAPVLGTLLQDAFALPHDTLITGDLPFLLSQLSLLPRTEPREDAALGRSA